VHDRTEKTLKYTVLQRFYWYNIYMKIEKILFLSSLVVLSSFNNASAGQFFIAKSDKVDTGIANIKQEDVQMVGEHRPIYSLKDVHRIWIGLAGDNNVGKHEENLAELMSIIDPPPVETKPLEIAVSPNAVVHFKTDYSKPISDMPLHALLGEVKDSDTNIKVLGYTDSTGTIKHNSNLSVKRARYVQNYLIKHGIAKTRIYAAGLGETRPVASNDTKEGKALNRRAEVIVHDDKDAVKKADIPALESQKSEVLE
jgi:outer membrane protein OmpA-like peptidoglycan-associated protein